MHLRCAAHSCAGGVCHRGHPRPARPDERQEAAQVQHLLPAPLQPALAASCWVCPALMRWRAPCPMRCAPQAALRHKQQRQCQEAGTCCASLLFQGPGSTSRAAPACSCIVQGRPAACTTMDGLPRRQSMIVQAPEDGTDVVAAAKRVLKSSALESLGLQGQAGHRHAHRPVCAAGARSSPTMAWLPAWAPPPLPAT